MFYCTVPNIHLHILLCYGTQGQARAPVKGPSTPTGFPWGVTYLAKAKQVTEMSSAGYYIHLELYVVTVCTFVPPHTYSDTQCKEMLYGLFSLQTNLCISLHNQSDVLWHSITNYKELLFSSDIWTGYILLQMSSWPDVVLLFAFLMCNFVL